MKIIMQKAKTGIIRPAIPGPIPPIPLIYVCAAQGQSRDQSRHSTRHQSRIPHTVGVGIGSVGRPEVKERIEAC